MMAAYVANTSFLLCILTTFLPPPQFSLNTRRSLLGQLDGSPGGLPPPVTTLQFVDATSGAPTSHTTFPVRSALFPLSIDYARFLSLATRYR